MPLFKGASSAQSTGPAYFKSGFMGMTGSGKTYTGGLIARGLWKLLVDRKILDPKTAVNFIDTENGSDFEQRRFKAEGVPFDPIKTRAFSDLVMALEETAKVRGILMIDSVTHFWRELCDSYARKRNKKRLSFEDWDFLKGPLGWGKFTERFINEPCHILMLGRAGFEYDVFTDEDEKKQMVKGDVKMKVENETGHEPNLLVLMERHQETYRDEKTQREMRKAYRIATVLKDRNHDMDGMQITDPKFDDFLPHINTLNLGGTHVGVDTSRHSDAMIPEDRRIAHKREMEQRDVALAEVQAEMVKHVPGQAQADKTRKADLLQKAFGTRAWEKVKTLPLADVQKGRNTIWLELNGQEYYFTGPQEPGESMADQLPDFSDEAKAEAAKVVPQAVSEQSKPEQPKPDKQAAPVTTKPHESKPHETTAAPQEANASGNGEPKGTQSAEQEGEENALAALIETELSAASTMEDLQDAGKLLDEAGSASDLPAAELDRLRKLLETRKSNLSGVVSTGDLF